MANTVRIVIPKGTWRLLATGPLEDCLIVSPRLIYYVYASAAPAPAWDRGYPIAPDEAANLVIEAGQGVYGYSPDAETAVYVTAG